MLPTEQISKLKISFPYFIFGNPNISHLLKTWMTTFSSLLCSDNAALNIRLHKTRTVFDGRYPS